MLIEYGGVPPLTATSCDVPTATATEGGTAVKEGAGVGCVGELLLLLQWSATTQHAAINAIEKILCILMEFPASQD